VFYSVLILYRMTQHHKLQCNIYIHVVRSSCIFCLAGGLRTQFIFLFHNVSILLSTDPHNKESNIQYQFLSVCRLQQLAMPSRLTVVLVPLLMVVLLLEAAAMVWLCVAILPTRMAELCSDECSCDPERYNVDSTNPSLTKTSFNFLKYLRQLTIFIQYIPSFGNDTFLSEGLTELEEISVIFSHLRTIELGALNGLTNLKKLQLFGNEIREILPGTFEKMSRLQILNLENNLIKSLNVDAFSGLISLVELNLRTNKLQYVHPDTFLSLPKLKFVYLCNNLGLQIPTDRKFINSNTLSRLSLAYCNVSSVSVETFANVSALEELDLGRNNLRTVDINLLTALPKLSSLFLDGNPLQCDCQLKKVWRCCKDRNIQTEHGELAPKCDTPSEMKGMGWKVLEKVQCLQDIIEGYEDYNKTNNNETIILETHTEPFSYEVMEHLTQADIDRGREADDYTVTNTTTDTRKCKEVLQRVGRTQETETDTDTDTNTDTKQHGYVSTFLETYKIPVYVVPFCKCYNRQCHHSHHYHMQQRHANCSQYVHPYLGYKRHHLFNGTSLRSLCKQKSNTWLTMILCLHSFHFAVVCQSVCQRTL